jgi:putative peptide zinc metalloprotease protein
VADRAAAMMALEQLHTDEANLADLKQRAEGLVAKAASDGIFTVPRAQDLPGRYLKRGDLLGYVMPPDRTDAGPSNPHGTPDTHAMPMPSRLARVVVTQDAIDLVRHATSKVLVRYAHQPDVVLEGRVIREVPSGAEYLPSRALTTDGGGQLATDPRDQKGAKTMERTFQFDVAMDSVPAALASAHYGERVYVRFDHAREPLGMQMWRGVRRLFLSHFQV